MKKNIIIIGASGPNPTLSHLVKDLEVDKVVPEKSNTSDFSKMFNSFRGEHNYIEHRQNLQGFSRRSRKNLKNELKVRGKLK